MATSPKPKLDLGSDTPSRRGFQPPLDRFGFSVNAGGVGGTTDIRTKGSLQRITELFGLCVCSLLTVLVIGWTCRLSHIEDWRLTAISATTGMLMFIGGAWYVSAQRSSELGRRMERGQ